MLSMSSFTHLIKRIHAKEGDSNDSNAQGMNDNRTLFSTSSMVSDEKRSDGMFNAIDIIKLMFVQRGCWHVQLERSCSNSINETKTSEHVECKTSCPFCSKRLTSCICPTKKRNNNISYESLHCRSQH